MHTEPYVGVMTNSREAVAPLAGLPRGITSDLPALPAERDQGSQRDDLSPAILCVLSLLAARPREAAILRLRDQLSNTEIAAKLGVSSRTVRAYIALATKSLREQLPAALGQAERD